jgi:hypothetical protein
VNWDETARTRLLFGSREPGGRFLDGDLPAPTPRRRYSRPPGRANAGPHKEGRARPVCAILAGTGGVVGGITNSAMADAQRAWIRETGGARGHAQGGLPAQGEGRLCVATERTSLLLFFF